MMTKEIELLKKAEHTLNMIPNQKKVGPKGESSYDIVSEISKFLKERAKFYEPKHSTMFLFLNDCNGNEGKDPHADLVKVHAPTGDVQELCDTIQKAERTQLGVMRMGGSWRLALEMAEYTYQVIKSGRESDFDDTDYAVEYRVISGNY